jgi:hypothetical protein
MAWAFGLCRYLGFSINKYCSYEFRGWMACSERDRTRLHSYICRSRAPPPVGHSPWPHTTWRRNVSAVRALICQPHPAAAAADISPCICCPAHLPLILSTHHTERAAVSMILPDINILSSLLVSVGTHQPGHRLLLLVGCDVILLVGCDDVLLVGCDDVLLVGCDDVLLVGCDLDVPDVPMS